VTPAHPSIIRPRKIYRDPFRASSTDRQARQQLRRRQGQPRPGPPSTFQSATHVPAPSSATKTSARGPAEAALAAASAAASAAALAASPRSQARSTGSAAEYKPLLPADTELLQRSTPSDSFSVQRTTAGLCKLKNTVA
jgi:hypothetical protein